MTMAILVLVATVFGTVRAFEDRNWWAAAFCAFFIGVQLAALGVV